MFGRLRPTYVLNLAGKVGGLFANMNEKVQYCEDNLKMGMNIVKSCHEFGVTRLVNILSNCIFPDKFEIPLREGDLHNGPPH